MLRALRAALLLSLAGQTSTHRLQPVQSSTATWSAYTASGSSFQRALSVLKVGGASLSSAGSKTLARMTACGQTITHLPHWMHRSGSHTGTSSAMLRFSYWVV